MAQATWRRWLSTGGRRARRVGAGARQRVYSVPRSVDTLGTGHAHAEAEELKKSLQNNVHNMLELDMFDDKVVKLLLPGEFDELSGFFDIFGSIHLKRFSIFVGGLSMRRGADKVTTTVS